MYQHTRPRPLRALALGGLAALAVAGTASAHDLADGAPSAPVPAPNPPLNVYDAAPFDETATPTTTPSTDDAPAPAAFGTVTVTQLAEHPGRTTSLAVALDDSTIIASSTTPSPEGWSVPSLVRLDATGAIAAETAVGDNNLTDIAIVGGKAYALVTPYVGGTCDLREIDPATLALGWPTSIGTECWSGALVPDPTTPSTVWIGGVAGRITSFDTATGTATPIDIAALVPAGYDNAPGLTLLGGDAYAFLTAAYDEVTGERLTAPDGSPLPLLAMRIDGATGQPLAPVEVPGYFARVEGDRLIAYDDEDAAYELDPTTLAATPVDDALGRRNRVGTADADVVWSATRTEGTSDLVVYERDAETLRVQAMGTVTGPWAPDGGPASIEVLTLGDRPIVIASEWRWVEATQEEVLNTWVFAAEVSA